jgi:hypothetical protein
MPPSDADASFHRAAVMIPIFVLSAAGNLLADYLTILRV